MSDPRRDDMLAQVIAHATRSPARIAIHFEGERYTYQEFARLVATYARYFRDELRLAPGARVAYLGANTPAELALLFACAQSGQVLVPLNWRLAAPELNAILSDCDATALVVEVSCLALAEQLQTTPHRLSVGAVSPQWRGLPIADAEAPLDIGSDLDQPLLITYTSGTTGRPKGAILSQRALASNARNSIHMHGLTAADRILTTLPLFHVGGMNIQTTPALAVGAEVILFPRFDPGRTLAAIATHRPSLTVLVPATLRAMIEHPLWTTSDLSSLRAVTTGSTDVPIPLIETWHARDVPVIQVYGATETAPIAIYQRIDEARTLIGAIGRAGIETEIRVVTANGDACGDDQPGELWVRGDHVARGYWHDQDADAFRDGWFRTGDVAARDRNGVFWFKDRIKNVIISGGENIYPAELERILCEHPGIKEAAVIGQSDPHWGAVPIAVVVTTQPALDSAAVLAMFKGRVARYKIPKQVLLIDALPRNTMGKVDHAALRQRIALLRVN